MGLLTYARIGRTNTLLKEIAESSRGRGEQRADDAVLVFFGLAFLLWPLLAWATGGRAVGLAASAAAAALWLSLGFAAYAAAGVPVAVVCGVVLHLRG